MDSKIKIGTYVGTAAAKTIEIGFAPLVMLVINSTDADTLAVWTSDMTAANGFVIDGTPATITSQGFTAYAGTSVPTALTDAGTASAGDCTITFASTTSITELRVGDIIESGGQSRRVTDLVSTTVASVSEPWTTALSSATVTRMTGRNAGVTCGTDNTGFNESAKTYTYIAFK